MTLLLLLSTYLSGFFFVSPNNNYSVLLPEGMELAQIDTLENNIINHIFIGTNTVKDFDFSLSIAAVETIPKDLTSNSSITDYEKKCKCNVISVERVEFNNFDGVKYKIESSIENTLLGGNVYISNANNNKSINVVCMALKESSNELDENLIPILNTMVLNFD